MIYSASTEQIKAVTGKSVTREAMAALNTAGYKILAYDDTVALIVPPVYELYQLDKIEVSPFPANNLFIISVIDKHYAEGYSAIVAEGDSVCIIARESRNRIMSADYRGIIVPLRMKGMVF